MVDASSGRATLAAQNVPVLDHGEIPNAISGMGPPPLLATVSFRVEWAASGERIPINNRDQGFAGEFIRNTATMEWSAQVGDFQLMSAPIDTSSSTFAQVGRERNGFFVS
jgi:hypothetical protein